MDKLLRKACVTIMVILATGCGYLCSGTWEDSPKNWGRAFQSKKPPEVEVVHSKYWRSAHFTCEFEYFFHIRSNDALKEKFFAQNELVKRTDNLEVIKSSFFGGAPIWFIPKPIDKYDVWIYKNEPRGNFHLFVDKETGDLFLTDNQV